MERHTAKLVGATICGDDLVTRRCLHEGLVDCIMYLAMEYHGTTVLTDDMPLGLMKLKMKKATARMSRIMTRET